MGYGWTKLIRDEFGRKGIKQNFTFVLIVMMLTGVLTLLQQSPAAADSWVDTTTEDFAQGTHENTENVDNNVRLITGHTQGQFTSQVFDAGEVVQSWDNISWSVTLESLTVAENDNVGPEPTVLIDGANQIGVLQAGTSYENTRVRDNVYESIQENDVGTLTTLQENAAYTENVSGDNLSTPDKLNADDGDNYWVDAVYAAGGPENKWPTNYNMESGTWSDPTLGYASDDQRANISVKWPEIYYYGYGTGTGQITGVVMHYELSTSGFSDDLWVLRHSVDGGSSWIEDRPYATGDVSEQVFSYDVTGERSWTWADISNLWMDFDVDAGGPPDIVTINIDAFWVEVTTQAGYDLEVQHSSAAFSIPAGATIGNVRVRLNFGSDNTAAYTLEIHDWTNSEWDVLNSGTVAGGTEVTWDNTLTTDPEKYVNPPAYDNIRVRLRTNRMENDYISEEDYLQFYVGYTPTDYRLNWGHRITGVDNTYENYKLVIYGGSDVDENVGIYIWKQSIGNWVFINNLPSPSYTIENTENIFPPTHDSYVDNSSPDKNYGSEDRIGVGSSSGYANRIFVKFDLSSVPEDANITQAELYLFSSSSTGPEVRVHRVDNDNWSEDTITWNNKPEMGKNITDYVLLPEGTLYWTSWTVTDFVKNEAAGDDNVSFSLVAANETSGELAWMHSKEHDLFHPRLEVTYTTGPGLVSYPIENINDYLVDDNIHIRYFENSADIDLTTIHIDYVVLEEQTLYETEIKFQVRAGSTDPPTGDFLGPDGSTSTYFITSPTSLENIAENRYFQYRAYLSTEDNTITPVLHDVTINYTTVRVPSSSVNPISLYWQTSTPFTVTATASDVDGYVDNVELWYRYSTDNSIWGPWTSFDVDNASPWSWSFTAPEGDGCYEFYSIATDGDGNVEGKPKAGLVGYWRFDEDSGSVVSDSSTEGNDGMIYGAQWTTGKVGSALEFDGVDDYVNIGDDTSLNFGTGNFSVEAWFKTAIGTGEMEIVSKGYYLGESAFALGIINGTVTFWGFDFDHDFGPQTDETYNDNNWHHVIGVRDGSNIYIYVDGALKKTDTADGLVNINNTDNLTIGPSLNLYHFNGIIDEVGIYNRTLSAEDVKARYKVQAGLADAICGVDRAAPPAPNLVSPTSGATTDVSTPTFDWSDVTDLSGVTYTFKITGLKALGHLTKTGLTSSTYTLTSDEALAAGTYPWQVRAIDNAGNKGNWSENWSLTVTTYVSPPSGSTPPPTPSLVSPTDETRTEDNTPTFDWSDVTDPGGVTYTLEIIDTLTKTGLTASTYTLTSDEALAAGTYSWRVRAIDGAGNVGEWSSTWSLIVTIPVLPGIPTSSVDPISPYRQTVVPFTVTAQASDNDGYMESVELWYRYSTDNSSWGNWKLFRVDGDEPWSWSFTALEGDGYYEFYSITRDNDNNVEPAPLKADARSLVTQSKEVVVVPPPPSMPVFYALLTTFATLGGGAVAYVRWFRPITPSISLKRLKPAPMTLAMAIPVGPLEPVPIVTRPPAPPLKRAALKEYLKRIAPHVKLSIPLERLEGVARPVEPAVPLEGLTRVSMALRSRKFSKRRGSKR